VKVFGCRPHDGRCCALGGPATENLQGIYAMRSDEVLRYTKEKVPQGKVARHYSVWRTAQGIPVRCDEPSCMFHKQELIWNGKPLKPILDHVNGNNSDNRPHNLRFLCGNCDSQLSTRGGANIGRLVKDEGGFALVSKDGRKDYVLPSDPTKYAVEGPPTRLVVKKNLGPGRRR
jgi:hypothetical protein